MMGPTEVPSQGSETIKIPTAHYEFGANFIDPKVCFCLLLLVVLVIRFVRLTNEICFFYDS